MKICGLMKTTLLDYPEHVACTVFTGGCNFRCPFCHNSEILDFFTEEEYAEEEIFDFLKIRGKKLEGICISGGEPTIHADLPDFITEIKKRFNLKVKLDTNGTNYEMLELLIGEGLIDYVAMDIKSGMRGYAKTSGIIEGSELIEKAMKSVRLLLSGTVDYEFRTTYVSGIHERKDFTEIAEMIKGADKYFIQAYEDSENVLNRNAGFKTPSKEDMKDMLDIVKPYVKYADIRGIEI